MERTNDAVEQAKRAQNQLVFKQTNEQIRDAIDAMEPPIDVAPFVCECSDPTCRVIVRVPLAVYERVRGEPRQFLHASGHEHDGAEGEIVGAFDGFTVVEKQGVAGSVAERADA